MEVIVRVIHTYHVPVVAEYGDDHDSLVAKGLVKLDPALDSYKQEAILMPEGAKL